MKRMATHRPYPDRTAVRHDRAGRGPVTTGGAQGRQGSWLDLQQRAGNVAVQNLVGGSRRLPAGGAGQQRQVGAQGTAGGAAVLRWANPESDNFWTDLAQDAALTVQNHILRNNERALAQLTEDLTSGEGDDSASITPDLIDFALDIAQASPAQKLAYKVLSKVYENVTATRPGDVEVADFASEVRDAQEEYQESVPTDWAGVDGGSPELFQRLKRMKEAESPDDPASTRQRALQLVREVRSNVPSYREIMRPLLSAWVGGAEDQTLREGLVDYGDPDGFSSGYLRMFVDIVPDARMRYRSHRFRAIALDDVDNPDGTKRALGRAYGEDHPLDELPFPGVIHLTMGSTIVILTKRNRRPTRDLDGWSARTVNLRGDNTEAWIEHRKEMYFEHIRPRIEHLRPDD